MTEFWEFKLITKIILWVSIHSFPKLCYSLWSTVKRACFVSKTQHLRNFTTSKSEGLSVNRSAWSQCRAGVSRAGGAIQAEFCGVGWIGQEGRCGLTASTTRLGALRPGWPRWEPAVHHASHQALAAHLPGLLQVTLLVSNKTHTLSLKESQGDIVPCWA